MTMRYIAVTATPCGILGLDIADKDRDLAISGTPWMVVTSDPAHQQI